MFHGGLIALLGITSFGTQSGGLLLCCLVCLKDYLQEMLKCQVLILPLSVPNQFYNRYYSDILLKRFLSFVTIFFVVILYILAPLFMRTSNTYWGLQVLLMLVTGYYYRKNGEIFSCVLFGLSTFLDLTGQIVMIATIFLVIFMLWFNLIQFIESLFIFFERTITPDLFEAIEQTVLGYKGVDMMTAFSLKPDGLHLCLVGNLSLSELQPLKDAILKLVQEAHMDCPQLFISLEKQEKFTSFQPPNVTL